MNTSQSIDTALGNLEQAIERIVAKWEAPDEAHERFRRWARLTSSELMPIDDHPNLTHRVSTLKNEFRSLHEQLARTLVQHGHVDEGLVSRRSFIAHLIDLVEPHLPVAVARHTFVRAAA